MINAMASMEYTKLFFMKNLLLFLTNCLGRIRQVCYFFNLLPLNFDDCRSFESSFSDQ